MIKLDQISVRYNTGSPLENHVLKSLSLQIPEGEFVTVIGSNGAGKSTLLNALSGEAPCESGRILLDDLDITKLAVQKRSKDIARVFQDPLKGTCESLTIEENMALAWKRTSARRLSWATKAKQRRSFIEKLQSLNLGLEKRLDDKVGLLSGGQRQALSLLMAALQPMKLLLLDEHTAALDPRTAKFILDLTNDLVSSNRLTTLMVTHSMKQALSYGSRTIMLHQGEVILDISGTERDQTNQQDLLNQFSTTYSDLDDDSLLLD